MAPLGIPLHRRATEVVTVVDVTVVVVCVEEEVDVVIEVMLVVKLVV